MSDKEYVWYMVTRDILAIQLLETALALINQIRNYAKENRITLTDNPSLDLLLAKAQNLIYEMDTTTDSFKLSDDSYHDSSNRRKVNRTQKHNINKCMSQLYGNNDSKIFFPNPWRRETQGTTAVL
jgi:hypothetical protein